MTTKLWLCTAALLVPTLAGCGGSSSSKNTSGPIFFVPHSVSATLSNGLTATLTEDRSTVPVGGTVTYTATLTNPTTQPITYQPVLSGANSFSVPAALVVGSPTGQTVYPTGPIAQYTGVAESMTLAPGQSVSGTAAVNTITGGGVTAAQGYAAPGQYTATAYFAIVPGAALGAAQIASAVGPLTVTAQ